MDHVQRGASFGMTVSPGQVALHDQAWAVLHQRMPHEAQHRPGAWRFLVEPGLMISGQDMRGVRTLLAPKPTSALRYWRVARGMGFGWGSG